MVDTRKGCVHSSQYFLILIFALELLFVNRLASALPLQLHEKVSFVKNCCVTEDSQYKKHVYGKSILDSNEPGIGTIITIYESPHYNQMIRTRYCVAKENPENTFCKRYSDNECREFTRHIKQKVIGEDGWIQEIWVLNGCGLEASEVI